MDEEKEIPLETTPTEDVGVDPNVEIRHVSQILYKKNEHQKMTDIKIMMMSSNTLPFFAEFLTFMNYYESTNLPTMGVNVQANGMSLFWNRDFVEKLPDNELLFVMVHECFHLLFDHTKRSIFYNHKLSNICQDMIINTIINSDVCMKINNKFGLGEIVKIPTHTDEFHKNADGTFILDNKGQKIKNKMFGKNMGLFIPKEYTGEPIFENLYEWFKDQYEKHKERKEKQESDQSQKGNQKGDQQGGESSGEQEGDGDEQDGDGSGNGNGNPSKNGKGKPKQNKGKGNQNPSDESGDGDGDGEEDLDSSGKPSYGKYGKDDVECNSLESIFDGMDKGEQMTLDSHLTDEVGEEARKSIVNDFVQRLKNRGLVSGDVEAMLNKLRKSKKNYLKEIKRVVSNNIIGTSKRKSITRPNRRGMEGIKGKKKFKNLINCILDTSGSMGGDFEKVLSYIFQNDIQINLIQIDTEVKSVDLIKNKRDLQKMGISGLGGTMLQPGIDYIADKPNKLFKFNNVILTDGYTDTLNFTNVKGTTLILTTATRPSIIDPFGRVKCIEIDTNNSINN